MARESERERERMLWRKEICPKIVWKIQGRTCSGVNNEGLIKKRNAINGNEKKKGDDEEEG